MSEAVDEFQGGTTGIFHHVFRYALRDVRANGWATPCHEVKDPKWARSCFYRLPLLKSWFEIRRGGDLFPRGLGCATLPAALREYCAEKLGGFGYLAFRAAARGECAPLVLSSMLPSTEESALLLFDASEPAAAAAGAPLSAWCHRVATSDGGADAPAPLVRACVSGALRAMDRVGERLGGDACDDAEDHELRDWCRWELRRQAGAADWTAWAPDDPAFNATRPGCSAPCNREEAVHAEFVHAVHARRVHGTSSGRSNPPSSHVGITFKAGAIASWNHSLS